MKERVKINSTYKRKQSRRVYTTYTKTTLEDSPKYRDRSRSASRQFRRWVDDKRAAGGADLKLLENGDMQVRSLKLFRGERNDSGFSFAGTGGLELTTKSFV